MRLAPEQSKYVTLFAFGEVWVGDETKALRKIAKIDCPPCLSNLWVSQKDQGGGQLEGYIQQNLLIHKESDPQNWLVKEFLSGSHVSFK